MMITLGFMKNEVILLANSAELADDDNDVVAVAVCRQYIKRRYNTIR